MACNMFVHVQLSFGNVFQWEKSVQSLGHWLKSKALTHQTERADNRLCFTRSHERNWHVTNAVKWHIWHRRLITAASYCGSMTTSFWEQAGPPSVFSPCLAKRCQHKVLPLQKCQLSFKTHSHQISWHISACLVPFIMAALHTLRGISIPPQGPQGLWSLHIHVFFSTFPLFVSSSSHLSLFLFCMAWPLSLLHFAVLEVYSDKPDCWPSVLLGRFLNLNPDVSLQCLDPLVSMIWTNICCLSGPMLATSQQQRLTSLCRGFPKTHVVFYSV